jgi:hypothetical protein
MAFPIVFVLSAYFFALHLWFYIAALIMFTFWVTAGFNAWTTRCHREGYQAAVLDLVDDR